MKGPLVVPILWMFQYRSGMLCPRCRYFAFTNPTDVGNHHAYEWARGDGKPVPTRSGKVMPFGPPENPNPWEVDNAKAVSLLFRVWFAGCRNFCHEVDIAAFFFGDGDVVEFWGFNCTVSKVYRGCKPNNPNCNNYSDPFCDIHKGK